MNINISTDLLKSFFMDFKKKPVNPKERAELLKDFRKAKGWSQRQLASELGISHSVIQDWELWNNISAEQIRTAKGCGFTNTDIYRSLRNHDEKIKSYSRSSIPAIDYEVKNCIAGIKPFIHKGDFSIDSEKLLMELKNVINRILIRIDKKHNV